MPMATVGCRGVAEEPEIARFAASLVRVEYDEEAQVTDVFRRRDEAVALESSTKPPESIFGPPKPRGSAEKAEKAFAAAEVRHSGEYYVPIEHHIPMVLYASTVVWKGEGKLTIYDKTQGVQNVHRYVWPFMAEQPLPGSRLLQGVAVNARNPRDERGLHRDASLRHVRCARRHGWRWIGSSLRSWIPFTPRSTVPWLSLACRGLWGLVMALLAVVPVLDAFIVWIPASIFLALVGSWEKAIILVLWGGLVVSTIDNLLYPMLVENRLKLHTVPAFIFLGRRSDSVWPSRYCPWADGGHDDHDASRNLANTDRGAEKLTTARPD
jgi:hypothetical protein